jgi:hypothetical protein
MNEIARNYTGAAHVLSDYDPAVRPGGKAPRNSNDTLSVVQGGTPAVNCFFGQCRFLIRVFVFRLGNDNLERRAMMSSIESAAFFGSRLMPNGSSYAWTSFAPRTLRVYAAAVLSRLRSLAPYAAIELVLPGGSLLALLLWLYRRYKKNAVPHGSLGGLRPSPWSVRRDGDAEPRGLLHRARPRLARDFVLRPGTTRAADRADELAFFDQRDSAA